MKKIAISATITPLLEDGSLDKAGLKNILERNIRHGLDGVFLLGSMGEWGSFDAEFKEDYVKTATEIVAGRMEVLAGKIVLPNLLLLRVSSQRRWTCRVRTGRRG